MIMNHHTALWMTINHIAQLHHITCAGLARKCRMDATTFNPSKRFASTGQARWISTETLAKILSNTNITPAQFAAIFQAFLDNKSPDAV